MAYQYRFCPTCGTQRAAVDHRCVVCGGLVRYPQRSRAHAGPADPDGRRPFASGWRTVAASDARAAARELSRT